LFACVCVVFHIFVTVELFDQIVYLICVLRQFLILILKFILSFNKTLTVSMVLNIFFTFNLNILILAWLQYFHKSQIMLIVII